MFTIESIPKHSIIIAPHYLHNTFFTLLSTSNNSIGTKIETIENFYNTFSEQIQESKIITFLKYREALSTILPQIPNFKSIALSSSFISECFDCLALLKFHNVPLSSLRSSFFQDSQLKLILETLYLIPTNADHLFKARAKIINKDLSHVYIIDTYFSYEQAILKDELLALGAHNIEFEQQVQTQYYTHAAQAQHEVEAVAQHIIKNKLLAQECTIQLCNNDYSIFIHEVFTRYHIPFNETTPLPNYQIYHAYQKAFNYAFDGSLKNLIALIDTHLLSIATPAFKKYLELFEPDLNNTFNNVKACSSNALLSQYDYKYLINIEEKAEKIRQQISASLKLLNNYDSFQSLATNIHQSVIERFGDDLKHYNAIQEIYRFLLDAMPLIDSHEKALFILECLPVPSHNPLEQNNGVAISQISEPMILKKYHFIIGANQSNFPNIKYHTGIFDEFYFDACENYPDLQIRYNQQIAQNIKTLKFSDHLLVSYSKNSIEGKSFESSPFLDNYFNGTSRFNAIEQYHNDLLSVPCLSEDISSALLLKDNVINKSLSSLERYAKCPFNFFVQDMLKLRTPPTFDLDVAHIGTLLHHILEVAVTTYQKQYCSMMSESEITELLSADLEPYIKLFPARSNYFQFLTSQLSKQLSKTLTRLNEYEKGSEYKPEHVEYTCEETIVLPNNVNLKILGRLDRIDSHHSNRIIFDYKSSENKFQKLDFFKGLQLQLPTYAMLLNAHSNQTIAGFYYITLRNMNIKHAAKKADRRGKNIITTSLSDLYNESIKQQRFNGASFIPNNAFLDNEGKNIVGFRINKDGQLVNSSYNIDAIEDCVKTILTLITSSMLSGNIAVTPIKNACTYCKFKSLCHTNNDCFDKKSYVVEDLLLKVSEVSE